MTTTRIFGRTGWKVGAVGLGCWAIGGEFTLDGRSDGWGAVDDSQSVRAIHLALELGANLFDSADAYGTGHSEEVLGAALQGRRDQAVIATKFGFTYDAERRALGAVDVSSRYIHWAVAQSLKRLKTDVIDFYQIHPGTLGDHEAEQAGEALERLVEKGQIRAWGWSTDDAAAARRMLKFPNFAGVQQELNILHDGPAMLSLCAEAGLASMNRSPLAMGLLSGKFTSASRMAATDVRGAGHPWVRHFENGVPTPQVLSRIEALRDLLTQGGRTLAQGALGWNLARSANTFPIPGFKTEEQVRDNLGALEKGPLPAATMAEIQKLLHAQTEGA
ncbi:aldo/keto reductase [Devosia sp. 1566]|uniref:aldo/keto reductase n=1 Tax=Devosia sp. 1566 TaxID=2499144 RepID=UPI000FDADEE2|nr:aldo/keto reductase [Devosia sp. 1566]